MAATFTGSVLCELQVVLAKDLGNSHALGDTVKLTHEAIYTTTDINQAVALYSQAIGALSVVDLDLVGSLLNAYGEAANFSTIMALEIKNTSVTAVLKVGNAAAANGWYAMFGNSSDLLTLRPGTAFKISAPSGDTTGYAVTAGTADILRITEGASSAGTFDLIITGRKA
jgi:hypothetical protein